ncbi:hypothetical protein ACHHYP_10949 [Achlya hypogyna]|uniref:Uncharacterized protein n=1 Tax=Achlya hypogyna TaxID=1202772 RepID=A0A1V9YK83_ACHHY|nr:hypothetical protein ACHHYP_10949 [Achlya hypogyna]
MAHEEGLARRRGTLLKESNGLHLDLDMDLGMRRGPSSRRLTKFEGGGRRSSKVSEAILDSSSGFASGRRSSRLDIPSPYGKDDDALTPEMPSLRHQKTELRLLHEEYGSLQEDQIRLLAKRDSTAADLERVQTEFNSASKHVAQIHTLLDKNKALQATQEAKHRMLETDLRSVGAHIEEAKKAEKAHVHTAKVNDVRLARTLEELEALKAELAEERSNRGGSAIPRAEHDRALQELQHYEKQKMELLAAFKKQIQLIDILKRQKIHLESAKLLSFIEDDFAQALQLHS